MTALKQRYSIDGKVGKDGICLHSFIFVLLLRSWSGSPNLPIKFEKQNVLVYLKTKVSYCRHRATLVKLVSDQTISTHYIADWLLDVDPKQSYQHFSFIFNTSLTHSSNIFFRIEEQTDVFN